jgi:hypothetical protein
MSILTVLAQVVIYVAVYGRLVRGRWATMSEAGRLNAGVNAKLR